MPSAPASCAIPLVARRIDSQDLVLVASPAYLRAHGTPARLEDLAGHKALVFRMPTSGRNRPWQLRQGRRIVELHPPHSAQISDTEALGAAALLGLGLCQLPDYVVARTRWRAASWSRCWASTGRRRCRSAPSCLRSDFMPPRVRVLLDALETLPRPRPLSGPEFRCRSKRLLAFPARLPETENR